MATLDGNGQPIPGTIEDKVIENGVLDGDSRSLLGADPDQSAAVNGAPEAVDAWPTEGVLSPMDVNNNGKVELPLEDTSVEYTKAQALKMTISHEFGHILGIGHNNGTCNGSCSFNTLMASKSVPQAYSMTASAFPLIFSIFLSRLAGSQTLP